MAGSKSYPKGSTPFRNADPIALARALAADKINVRGTGRAEDGYRARAAEEADRAPVAADTQSRAVAVRCVVAEHDPHKVRGRIRDGDFVFEESDEFNTRLRIAVAQDDATLQCLAIVMGAPSRRKVSVRQFAAWVPEIRRVAPAELLAMADEQKTPMPASPAASHDAAATAATSKHSANVGGDNVFTAMPRLRWDEITITFTELEAARVKARGKTETFMYGVMGFRDRKRHTAKPNICWSLLMGLAIVSTSDTPWCEACPTSNLKRGISRLRDQLRRCFGIAEDPIVFKKGDGYQPVFNLTIEEHVTRKAYEQHHSRASEDEGGEDLQREMEEVPGTRSR